MELEGPAAQAVLVARDGPILTVTLNRPRVLNAVNAEISAGVGDALRTLAQDDCLRVGIVTGAGRAFCAGADLAAVAKGERIDAPGHREWGFAGITEHFVAKPLIAAVNGVAMGGGAEIALACDLVVMAASATIGLPEVRRGLVAGAGGLIRLPQRVPAAIAAELILTGDPIGAEDALRWGLANRVVADSEVLSAAKDLAARIAGNAPLALAASKRVMHRHGLPDSAWAHEVWDRNDEEFMAILRSEGAREGARAFVEKQEPLWRAR